MAEREASGDFDYPWDDPSDADGLTGHEDASQPEAPEELDYRFRGPDDDLWDDPDDDFWNNDPESGEDGSFDAFKPNTWSFQPAPTPWHRSKQVVTALIAAAVAMAAIVVSGVLLVFRTPGNTVDETTPVTPVTPTAPSSAAPATVATSAQPPPPPPPPPPESSASTVNTAPEIIYPTVRPRPTKEPEIGVTRTPATRSPISVAPQPRRPR